MLQIRIIVICSMCIFVSCDKEEWLDPLDFHSYDHVNKVMRTTTSEPTDSVSTGGSEALQNCQATLQKYQSTKNKQKYTYDLLMAKLQRQTAIILQSAQLMNEETEGTDSYYTQRYMLISLTSDQLKSLQKFANSGKLDLEQVDEAWQNMWTLLDEPGYSKWDWIAKWLPLQFFSHSKENFVLLLEVCVIALPMVLIILKMSVFRAMFVFITLLFSVSAMIRYHRVTQADEMRQRHLIAKPEDMPPECRPHLRSSWEKFTYFFSTNDAVKCAKYYEATFTDPLTHTTPLEQMVLVITDIGIHISENAGVALNKFTSQVFIDLPWPLNLLVGHLTNVLVVVIILVLIVVLTSSYIKKLIFKIFRGDVWSTSVVHASQESIGRDRTPSQITITNHGHLVLENGTSGLEFLNSKTHALLLRTQSESGILYSSQSTSTSELNYDQSEINRGRSHSQSAIPEFSNNSSQITNKTVNVPLSKKNSLVFDSGVLKVVNEENEQELKVKSNQISQDHEQEMENYQTGICKSDLPVHKKSSLSSGKISTGPYFATNNSSKGLNDGNEENNLVDRVSGSTNVSEVNSLFLVEIDRDSEFYESTNETPKKSNSPQHFISSPCSSLSPPPNELSNLLESMSMEDPNIDLDEFNSSIQHQSKLKLKNPDE